MASMQKCERGLFPAGATDVYHQPGAATRFLSHGSGQPRLELRIATKLSSAGFEPFSVLRPLVYESVALTTWPCTLQIYSTVLLCAISKVKALHTLTYSTLFLPKNT